MNKTILLADTILAGEDLIELKNQCIIVNDGKIEKITSRDILKNEKFEEYDIIDLKDKTLLPGLIEGHNHVTLDARMPEHLEMLGYSSESELTLVALKALEDDLMAGVTTARCLSDKYNIDIVMKKKINKKEVIGPNLLVAGTGLRGIHGSGYIGTGVAGIEEFRRSVRMNLAKGVDMLKLFITPGLLPVDGDFIPSYLSPEEIKVVSEEGKRLNIATVAHCVGGQGLKDCLENGVELLEHLYAANDKDIELLVKHNATVGLTSGIYMDPSREEFLSDSNVEKTKLRRAQVIKNLEKVVKSGVKFTLGTDAYHTFLYKEVLFAIQLGSNIKTALKGITSTAADVYGISNKTGSLIEGLHADIIAVNGNPLQNPEVLKDVNFVMKNGTIYKNI